MLGSWKKIPGYDFYEVSDLGDVRSIDRWITRKDGRSDFWRGRTLQPLTGPHGYLQVNLGASARNKYIHKLVMLAFVGEPPLGHEVAHNNGDPSDNRLSNLRYDTVKGNEADKVSHGTHRRGERHPLARLTAMDIRVIRESTLDKTILRKRYGISRRHLSDIINRRRWSYLEC